jgi:hypothetical protein
MKPLMLAHVVLQSDYCMGHESNRVEISSCVGIPTLALGKSLHRVTRDTQKTQRTLQ